MTKAGKAARKILKVLLWILAGVVFLLITAALLIQLPSVQNKLIHYAADFVSKKTKTEVTIGRISILFPKTVSIQDLYIEDQSGDTLLFGGEIGIGLDMWGLLQNDLHFNSVTLKNITGRISSTAKDSLLNYNFLLEAFTDTSTAGEETNTGEPAGKKGEFAIDNVNLENVNLVFDDKFNGIYASAILNNLEVKINELDFDRQHYDVESLHLNGFAGNVLITKESESESDTTPLPSITIADLLIKNAKVSYSNHIAKQDLQASLGEFGMEKSEVHLAQNKLLINTIELKNSNIAFKQATDTAATATAESVPWNITIKNTFLENNTVVYDDSNAPVAAAGFDPSHFRITDLNFNGKDILYSQQLTAATINSFSFTEREFTLKQLTTVFRMDANGISAGNLYVENANSIVEANAVLKYKSLEQLKEFPGETYVNLSVTRSSLAMSDLFYFNSALRSQPYISNIRNISYSGKISGTINNLRGNVHLTTGNSTNLITDFQAKGLPDIQTAWFDLPNLRFQTSKADVITIFGSKTLPDNIHLPATLSFTAAFKGSRDDFAMHSNIHSAYGSALVEAALSKGKYYDATFSTQQFDIGKLLNDSKMFGPVTIEAKVKGSGLDTNSVNAKVQLFAEEIYLNQYNYHNLSVNGQIIRKQFEGNVSVNDTNIVFDFGGLVNMNSGEEQFKFTLDLKGADLKQLHFSDDDIRIGLKAEADLKGKDVNSINGKAGVTQLLIAKHGQKYLLDSILFATVNETGRSEVDLQSAIVGIKYRGTFAPSQMMTEIKKHINEYIPIDSSVVQEASTPQNFSFEINLRNHPVIADVFLPKLTEFEPGTITGEFSSEKKELKISANLNRLTYDSIFLKEAGLAINSNGQSLDYSLTCAEIRNPQVKLQNLLIGGSAKNNEATVNIECTDDEKANMLDLSALVRREGDLYILKMDPSDLIIAKKQWQIPADNSITFGPQGMRIEQFILTSAEEKIAVQSVNKQFNDDLSIEIKSLKLHDIADIMKQDVTLVSGILDGNILLKRIRNTYGFTADAQISNLALREIPAGNITIKATNTQAERFDADIRLSGNENDVIVLGNYIPLDSTGKLDFNVDIKALSLTTIEAFSMGAITNSAGKVTGTIDVAGTTAQPLFNGSLRLLNAHANPAVLNNRLFFEDETITLDEKGIYMQEFTIADEAGHKAIVDGSILKSGADDFRFDLTANTNDFLLFNTSQRDNKEFYGKMIIDSRINIKGDMHLPVVTAQIKLKEGSDFTFSVPEEKLTRDKGEGVVLFVDSMKFHPIIIRNEEVEKQKGELQGYDIRANIEVDKNALLKLRLDPTTSDSLVVQGDAALSFSLDPSGKMSLTGTYTLTDGSYLVSLQSLIRKKFTIEEGSTITWNGDVLDATVDIRAIYTVRTSPIDLVADQLTGLSEADRNSYRMRLPFNVYLKLNGSLMLPEISFEIQLPPGDKGALGGAVNTKLQLLNQDPSALNKQVFALLVLGRFIQENPLESESNIGLSTVARTSVSKFLSHQLNQLGSKVLPGVELSVDVQSYDDYTSGEAEGRTEVGIGLEKQLFDDRVTVQVGGTVDVEGERAKQNNASDITGDVTIEYKLTEDGRYRLKGFRHNEYEGALEGQLVETGVGIVYTRDFNRWKNFLKLSRREKKQQEENNEQ